MKKTNNIACPFCHKEFQLTDAITTQIENELKSDFQERLKTLKTENIEAMENQKKILKKDCCKNTKNNTKSSLKKKPPN